MSQSDAASPRAPETAPRAAPFARKLGFTADQQRLLEAVMRGRHRAEHPA